MRSWTIGFGREVNVRPGQRMLEDQPLNEPLYEQAWQDFKNEMHGIARNCGRIVFSGAGRGRNTVTGALDEEGHCIVVVPHNSECPFEANRAEEFADCARRYGQVEVAFTSGWCSIVKGKL